jgi:SAM-dependent methyltransferase
VAGTAATSVDYWNRFYARWRHTLPSQFAALVASELAPATLVVDIGCGNGRDTFFFARSGFPTIGIDRSSVSIEANARMRSAGDVRFINADITACDLAALMPPHERACFYARFFLHAIDDATEDALLGRLAEIPEGSLLCLEFRTLADEATAKTFGDHDRRYIDHEALVRALPARGFQVDYERQGRGMAKFRDEDPYVGRILASKVAG